MSKNVDNRETVTPGTVLYEGDELTPGDGAFASQNKIKAAYAGSVEFRRDDSVKVIPKQGKYMPSQGDSVIGEIERVGPSNWNVDIASPYSGFMHVNAAVDEYVDHDDDISQWYDMGDAIVAKVVNVTKGKDVKLTMDSRNCRKLEGGRIVEVPPSTVPRIIGRKGSMVDMIKDATDTMVIIGQNGRVWIRGDNAGVAAKAVKKVADEAHTENLTDRMEEWLEAQTNPEVK